MIQSDALTGWPRNNISGDHIVSGDIRAVADDDTPAVAIEIITGHRHSLSPNQIHSVVGAGEYRVARYYFSPAVRDIETIAVTSQNIASHRAIIAGTVVHSVRVRCQNIACDADVLRCGE